MSPWLILKKMLISNRQYYRAYASGSITVAVKSSYLFKIFTIIWHNPCQHWRFIIVILPGSTKIIPTPCPISGSTPATPRRSSSTASIRALTEDKSVISYVHSEGIINLHTNIALSFVNFNNALIGGLYRNVT